MKKGYVYLFKAQNSPFIKVGFSQTPPKRMKNLRQNTPFELIEWKKIQGSMEDEKKIHKLLRNNYPKYIAQARGEWYKILTKNELEIRNIIGDIMCNFRKMKIEKKHFNKNFSNMGEFMVAIEHLR